MPVFVALGTCRRKNLLAVAINGVLNAATAIILAATLAACGQPEPKETPPGKRPDSPATSQEPRAPQRGTAGTPTPFVLVPRPGTNVPRDTSLQSINDPSNPLPADLTITFAQPYQGSATAAAEGGTPGGPISSVESALEALPVRRGDTFVNYPMVDCAYDFPAQDYYYNLVNRDGAIVSPNAGVYTRITFQGGARDQQRRVVVWSGTRPVTWITTVGWRDSTLLQWPGGEFRFHHQRCDSYAFFFYSHTAYSDVTPNRAASGTSGLIRASSDQSDVIVEWGPHVKPPPPEPAYLVVGYKKACKGVNVGFASGYVATNYGRARAVAADKTTLVTVRSLSVSMQYDPPTFPLTRNPSRTVENQAQVEVGEQLRSIGLGWNAGEVCRGFRVNASVVTMNGRKWGATIHTR